MNERCRFKLLQRPQIGVEAAVVDRQHQLEVQVQAAHVEVDRAEQRVRAVDGRRRSGDEFESLDPVDLDRRLSESLKAALADLDATEERERRERGE